MSDDKLLRSMVDPSVVMDPCMVAQAVEEIFPEALGVWIYGSFADGTARKDSDIDIAILPERRLLVDWDYFGRIGELISRLHRDVDLVDLRAVSPLLRYEVFTHGRRIAARDPLACDRFETTAISAYQRLNVERRDLLAAIRERGSVY